MARFSFVLSLLPSALPAHLPSFSIACPLHVPHCRRSETSPSALGGCIAVSVSSSPFRLPLHLVAVAKWHGMFVTSSEIILTYLLTFLSMFFPVRVLGQSVFSVAGDILWIRRFIRFVKIYVKTIASRQHL